MIIVKLIGWLGNQMFQYAIGRALSIKHNRPLLFDISYASAHPDSRLHYALSPFTIQWTIADKKHIPRYYKYFNSPLLNRLRYPICFIAKKLDSRHIIENPYHPIIRKWMFDFNPHISSIVGKHKDYVYLEWFRQSEKYFDSIQDTIREDFTLKNPLDDHANKETIHAMNNTNAVSFHIRRTDYIWSYLGGIATEDYYQRAVTYIKDKISDPTFFVFSDDIARCRENLDLWAPSHYIDRNTGADSYKDIILMSYCKHNIIANSTFSRRGAWLNPNPHKIVIAPKTRHQNLDYRDTIPNTWVRL